MSSSPTDQLVEVTLPDLGDEAVTVVAWSKEPGDEVASEEPLCLIAVGPAHAEVGSPAHGILATIAVPAGSTVSPGLRWPRSRPRSRSPSRSRSRNRSRAIPSRSRSRFPSRSRSRSRFQSRSQSPSRSPSPSLSRTRRARGPAGPQRDPRRVPLPRSSAVRRPPRDRPRSRRAERPRRTGHPRRRPRACRGRHRAAGRTGLLALACDTSPVGDDAFPELWVVRSGQVPYAYARDAQRAHRAGADRGARPRRPAAARAPARLHQGPPLDRGGASDGRGLVPDAGDRDPRDRPRRPRHLPRPRPARRLSDRRPRRARRSRRRPRLRSGDGAGDDRGARRLERLGRPDRGTDRGLDRGDPPRAGAARRRGRGRAQDRVDRRPRQPRRHHPRLRDQRRERSPAVRVDRPLRDRGLPDDLADPRAGQRAGRRRVRGRPSPAASPTPTGDGRSRSTPPASPS